MRNDERRVRFFEVRVRPSKVDGMPPAMSDVLQQLKLRADGGNAQHDINAGSATLEIAAVDIDSAKNRAVLLLRISDRNGSDAYFSDPKNSTSRVERKQGNEGRGYGAHLLLSTSEYQGKPGIYAGILEVNTGLHIANVIRLLHGVLNDIYKEDAELFCSPHKSGKIGRDKKPKMVCFRPMFEFLGLPSDQLVSDLENGTLRDVVLIDSTTKTSMGSAPWLQQHETAITLKPAASMISNVWSAVCSAAKAQVEHGFSKARIRFKSPDNQQHTIDFDPDTGALLNDEYVKSIRLTAISPPLDESADALVPHFVKLLDQALVDHMS